jgi:hypothetical protein
MLLPNSLLCHFGFIFEFTLMFRSNSQGRGVLFDLELQTATWWLAHNTISKKFRNGYHRGDRVMTSQGRGVLFDLELQTATWWLAHNTISKKFRNGYHRGELVEDLARDLDRGYVQPDELKLMAAARDEGEVWVVMGDGRLWALKNAKKYAHRFREPPSQVQVTVHPFPFDHATSMRSNSSFFRRGPPAIAVSRRASRTVVVERVALHVMLTCACHQIPLNAI